MKGSGPLVPPSLAPPEVELNMLKPHFFLEGAAAVAGPAES